METSTPIPTLSTGTRPARWRMILEIARKDIFMIAKTPSISLIILLPFFMQLMFQLVFSSLSNDEPLRVVIYDPAGSRLAGILAALPDIELLPVASQPELETAMATAGAGITVPADFESALANGDQPALIIQLNPQPDQEVELADFRRHLVEELWLLNEHQAPVHLSWISAAGAANPVDEDDKPNDFLLTLVLISGMAMTGFTVSLLIVEEKEERTLDALLLSPAGKVEFVAGKGLAVLFYTLVLAGAMLMISGQINGAWWITTITIFFGASFTVGIGLLLGTFFNTKNQCNAWGGILLLILMIPAMLAGWQPSQIWLIVLSLIPTFYLTDALIMTTSETVVAARLGLDLAVLAGCALLAFFLTRQRLRRGDWMTG